MPVLVHLEFRCATFAWPESLLCSYADRQATHSVDVTSEEFRDRAGSC